MLEYYFGQFKIKPNLYILKGYKLFILPSLLSFFFFYPDRKTLACCMPSPVAANHYYQLLAQTHCLLPIYYTSFPPRSTLLSLNFLLSLSVSCNWRTPFLLPLRCSLLSFLSIALSCRAIVLKCLVFQLAG